jgi:hypothetical protein
MPNGKQLFIESEGGSAAMPSYRKGYVYDIERNEIVKSCGLAMSRTKSTEKDLIHFYDTQTITFADASTITISHPYLLIPLEEPLEIMTQPLLNKNGIAIRNARDRKGKIIVALANKSAIRCIVPQTGSFFTWSLDGKIVGIISYNATTLRERASLFKVKDDLSARALPINKREEFSDGSIADLSIDHTNTLLAALKMCTETLKSTAINIYHLVDGAHVLSIPCPGSTFLPLWSPTMHALCASGDKVVVYDKDEPQSTSACYWDLTSLIHAPEEYSAHHRARVKPDDLCAFTATDTKGVSQ